MFLHFDIAAYIAPKGAPFAIAAASTILGLYAVPYLSARQLADTRSVSGNYWANDYSSATAGRCRLDRFITVPIRALSELADASRRSSRTCMSSATLD